MPYYLKIVYGQKIKKFIVKNPKLINLHQIKYSFTPPITSSHLSYELNEPNDKEKSKFFKSQSALLSYLQTQSYPDKYVVKLIIFTMSTDKDEEQLEEQADMLLLQKNKSKSDEVKVRQRAFESSMMSMQITQQFLFNSLCQSGQKKEEAHVMVKNANKKLKQLQQKSRKTDLNDLLDFLNS